MGARKFLSPKLFSAKVKRFFVIFAFIELEEASTGMKTMKTKMSISLKKKIKADARKFLSPKLFSAKVKGFFVISLSL